MIFKVKSSTQELTIEGGEIYNIKIENPHCLIEVLRSFNNYDEDYLFLYDNGKLLEPSKYILFISDVLNLELNIKKQLTALYTKIEKELINDAFRDKLNELNSKINELMMDITLESNIQLDYDEQIGFKDIFSLVNLRYFSYEKDFKNQFIYYCKATRDISKTRIIATYGLLDLLTNEEIVELKKELSYLHITIINIGNSIKENLDKIIIIDNDLCEIS